MKQNFKKIAMLTVLCLVLCGLMTACNASVSNYKVEVTCGANGQIVQNAAQYAEGKNAIIAVAPNAGYHTLSVKIDGVAKDIATTYTIENIKANHTVEAIFEKDFGLTAYEYLEKIEAQYNKRAAGTADEITMSEFVKNELESMGYTTTSSSFTDTGYYYDEEAEKYSSKSYDSQNIVAIKKGKTDAIVMVGAHYDAVTADPTKNGFGIDDNGSGVAVMLEAAKYYADKELDYTLYFVSYGAEEVGCLGSYAFFDTLSEEVVSNIKLYINLDSLAAGDYCYVHAFNSEYSLGLAEQVVAYGETKNLTIMQQMGLSMGTGNYYELPFGTTSPDFSDNAVFDENGIDYLYFEASNWQIGELDGYTQTVKVGEVWHTTNDKLSVLNELFPGRVASHMETFATMLIYAIALPL